MIKQFEFTSLAVVNLPKPRLDFIHASLSLEKEGSISM